MHIKHQKTKEVGRCLASRWLKQTVINVFFFFRIRLLGAVCRDAALIRGTEPPQPGHVHEPPPPKITRGAGWEEMLLNRCTVPELDRGGRALTFRSNGLRPGSPLLLTLDSLPLWCERAHESNKHCAEGRGWRIRRLGDYQT